MRRFTPTILSMYFIREQLPPLFVGILFFTFVLVVNKIVLLLSLLIEKDVPVRYSLELFILILPFTMALTVPVSILMATIMAMGRLSSDSEIIAMRASGISYFSIYKSLFVMGILYTIFMIWFNNYVLPYANYRYRVLYDTIAKSQPISLLDEGVFNVFPENGQTIYARTIGKDDKMLHGIVIYKKREQGGWNIIVADRGKWIVKSPENNIKTLRLFQGRAHLYDEKENYTIIDFTDEYMDINLFEQGFESTRVDRGDVSEKEKSMEQIYTDLAEYARKQQPPYSRKVQKEIAYRSLEFWKHLSIPFACLALTIIGLPLGIVSHRSGKGMGFGLAVVASFIYYILLMGGERSARALKIPSYIGAWMPVVVVTAFGVVLIFFRNSAENVIDGIRDLARYIIMRLPGRKSAHPA